MHSEGTNQRKGLSDNKGRTTLKRGDENFLTTSEGCQERGGTRVGMRNQPRDCFGGPNGVANGHFGSQGVTSGGDGKHETHGKRGHRRRQFVGCGDLGGGRVLSAQEAGSICESFDTYPCGSKCLDETVEVEE